MIYKFYNLFYLPFSVMARKNKSLSCCIFFTLDSYEDLCLMHFIIFVRF